MRGAETSKGTGVISIFRKAGSLMAAALKLLIATAISLTFICTSPAYANEAKQPVNLGDYFRLKRTDDPRISPDGRVVAYVELSPKIDTDRYQSSVRIAAVADTFVAAQIRESYDTYLPRWSSDGSHLSYIRADKNGIELVSLATTELMSAKAPQLRMIATLPSSPIDYAWSPDGSQIAALFRLGAPLRQSAAAVAPNGTTWIAGPKIYGSPVSQQVNEMLPDTANDFALFVISTQTGATRRITEVGSLGEALPYTRPDIVWMPDGNAVLLSLNLSEKGYLNALQGLLYEVNVQNGSLKKHAGTEGGAYFNPSYARNGVLGFSCRAPSRNNLIRFEFCTENARGVLNSAAPEIDSMIYPAKVALDGNGFYGVYGKRGIGRLAWFGPNGQREILAETGGGDANAYLDGGSLTVSNDGTVAFLLSNGEVPSAVATVRRGGKPIILADPNGDYIAGRHVIPGQPLTFRPVDGAQDVGGFLFKPQVQGNKQKPPAIIMLHGGQSSDYGPDFDLVPQIFAAHGYMVMLPNYRGSGSYGREFANASTSSPVDREFDVEGAADAIVAAGADPERLYLMGGSGGGMITGWTIGTTNRFRAAVMWYPTTEWWLFAMESAVGPTTLSSFRNAPWEDPAEYISRSPYAQIGKVQTPTMLIIGDHDRITPMSGSIAFFRGLRVLGIDAELVVYPGAAHGIDTVPSQAMGHIAETLTWLERHGGAKVQLPILPKPSDN